MEMKDEKKAKQIAEERMAIIAPLLNPGLDTAEIRRIRQQIAENGGPSERTVDRYLKHYLQDGFNGLMPEGKNPNAVYKIPESLVEEAIQLRRELPSRSVASIIQILEMEGKAEKGFLKKSTLQDALQRKGYSASMMKIYQDKGYASQRFARKHRNDLWQGDIKNGPVLKLKGAPTQTYLSLLIDDCTRFPVHGEFYANMKEEIVEDTLHKAILKAGAPRRLFFDNGSQYRTRWMKRACMLLGIRLIYSRPTHPQGKGKVERLNGTVNQFERFQAWLNECYTTVEHSALGTSPEVAFKSDSMPLRFVDADVMARAFLHCESRKVDKSGCISFKGKSYDLTVRFAGRTVDVVYDPSNTDILTIETNDCAPFQVTERKIGEHTATRPKMPKAEVTTENSRLLDAAEKAYKAKTIERQRSISYSSEVRKEA